MTIEINMVASDFSTVQKSIKILFTNFDTVELLSIHTNKSIDVKSILQTLMAAHTENAGSSYSQVMKYLIKKI